MNQEFTYEKMKKAGITAVQGIKAAAVHCGLKKKARPGPDMHMRKCARGSLPATVQAAPVKLCRDGVAADPGRGGEQQQRQCLHG